MNSEINKVLSQNEKIIWEGRPQKTPYIISNLMILFFTFVILAGATRDSFTGKVEESSPIFIFIGLVIFFIFSIYMYISYSKIYYAITDKRVIFQKGIIGRDFESVDFDKMNSISVNVGLIDKMFGKNSGTILIDTGRLETTQDANGYTTTKTKYHRLDFIDDVYSVYEKLKKISTDVKSDINFPNALRPANNLGYKTNLENK